MILIMSNSINLNNCVDVKTHTKGVLFDEAMQCGLINIKEHIFIEPTTNAKMPLDSAIRHGLLIIPRGGVTLTLTTETTEDNLLTAAVNCIASDDSPVRMISFQDGVNRGLLLSTSSKYTLVTD